MRMHWTMFGSSPMAITLLLISTGASAQSSPTVQSQAAASGNEAYPDSTTIVVTANRREQNLTDIGSSLQVLTGAELQRIGAAQVSDFILRVPGVSFREQGNGATRIALRGVSNVAAVDSGAGSTGSTVGLYFGDVPIQGTSVLPNLATNDLARVEVLKGPQGTLYGEGAMGGAVRLIPNPVDLDRLAGTAEGGISTTQGGEASYLGWAMLNVPLVTDKLGIRIVGSYRNDGGFIDNVATGRNNYNVREGYSFRGTIRARPSERLELELLGIYNKDNMSGFNQVSSLLKDLQIGAVEDRYNNTDFKLGAATINYDLDFAKITASASYNAFDRDFADRYPSAVGLFSKYTPISAQQERFVVNQKTSAYEIRMVSNGDQAFDWVIGAFYRDRQSKSDINLNIQPNELVLLNEALAELDIAPFPSREYVISLIDDGYRQTAVYGEGTLALANTLDFTAGVRYFSEKVKFRSQSISYSYLSSVNNINIGDVKDSRPIFKFNLTWRPSPLFTLYAQAAEGYRSGGVNFQAVRVGAERTYKSDSLWNYEVGLRAESADRRLQFNLAAFYVDWQDIQSNYFAKDLVLGTDVGLVSNGGKARNYGLEGELVIRPVNGLTLGGNLSVISSELIRTARNSDIIPGQRLPNTPAVTGTAFGDYRWSFNSSLEAFAGFDAQYTDAQRLRFKTATFDGFPVEQFILVNARAGVRNDHWTVQAFVNNLTNERAQLGRGLSLLTSTANADFITISRPRTIGVRASVNF